MRVGLPGWVFVLSGALWALAFVTVDPPYTRGEVVFWFVGGVVWGVAIAAFALERVDAPPDRSAR